MILGQAIISFLFFPDARGEGTPICQALVKSESKEAVMPIISKLASLEPEACSKVRAITTDCSHAFANAWMAVMGTRIQVIHCSWHLQRAWTRNIREDGLLKALKNLRLQTVQSKFEELYKEIQEKWVSSVIFW